MNASTAEARFTAGYAMGMVLRERERQIEQKGYTTAHDDEHAEEQLAAAAAFYLLPSYMNQDVCEASGDGGLRMQTLQSLVGEGAWDEIERLDDDVETNSANRVNTLVRGLALGLAELERVLRMRRATNQDGGLQ